MLLRRLARPLLASKFVLDGVDAIKNPGPHKVLADTVYPITSKVPQLATKDADTLVRIHGGIQIGAGVLLGLNKLPRLSALTLAATMVPVAMADKSSGGKDLDARRRLAEDASTVGALLLAAADTEGRPGLGWRAQHRVEHTAAATRRTRRQARLAVKAAKAEAQGAAKAARAMLPG